MEVLPFFQASNDDEDKEHHWSFCQHVLSLSKNGMYLITAPDTSHILRHFLKIRI